ncbi:HPr kinase/phosphorylase [Gemmatimonadetes bacterium T265]|nr:HPr kinase/phosphorylase [Gemmatimonadetes bacterium T265]
MSPGRAAFTVARLVERLAETTPLEQLGAPVGLTRPVPGPEASSPGLVLAGYVDRFAHERVQVLGETEVTYVTSLAPEVRARNLERFFSFPIPCLFISKGQEPPDGLLSVAERAGVGVFRTTLKTSEFYDQIKPLLADEFAPTVTLHGSLADVYGVGLFFTGMSGIGKSECVLDLVERGHRLVADDLLIVKRRGIDVLIGRGHELQRHHMEIRGIGLIDIPAIFGVRAVRQQKRVEVCVHLEPWDQEAVVDRTGLDGETQDILGVPLPLIRVPLNPGKNITVIAEVIAMNHLLRYSTGVDPAEAFNQRLIGRMRAQAAARESARPLDLGGAGDGASRARAHELQRYLRDDDE